MTALFEVGPGFWNIRTSFKIIIGLVDIGTHMSIARLSNGNYLVIDAVPLSDEIKAGIDLLTNKGEKIEAFVATHPFHTLAIPAFYKEYPKIPYYGCPRHIRRLTEIPWAGDLNNCEVRDKWKPDVELRIPAGAEFVNPLPEKTNHFICVFAFHKESKTIHVDDTITYSENPGFLLKMGGFKHGTLAFHPSIKGPGLLANPEAPFQFRDWVHTIINDWDFENLCAAHTGCKIGGAREQLKDVTEKAEPLFQKLSEKRKDPKYKGSEETPSNNVKGEECG